MTQRAAILFVRSIAEAIGSRDGDIAEMLMRKHIRTSRAAWVESLNDSNDALRLHPAI
jgi:DNA-binding GntR family transcriptional regulator